ncbi:hypothetical protein COU57_04020 [Candidatus Pacearchaeota archaeon CG10_big_fil_rev_8_21_14_0_10_32_14]|nr:MAG: hypothetical protein COU57_04020 [Candidatus Pacearchaeota archaeon CG10_big_fil_rev_8_21_14_0_10_32_14]
MIGKEGILHRKGQVTIFIIIAVIVVFAAILFYMFWPNIKDITGGNKVSPQSFIQNCLEDKVSEVVVNLSNQGGYLEPELFYEYKGSKIEYLCYTNEYYKTCVMQQPLLFKQVADEIVKGIKEEENSCFNDLIAQYENEGYSINIVKKNVTSAELLPQRILVTFNRELTIKKGDETSTIDRLEIVLNNNLYEHIGIASSILEYETKYGDAETTTYMNIYPDLKVEKYKEGDGTTIYILTDRNNPESKFQFASRSVAWPPGYGIGA